MIIVNFKAYREAIGYQARKLSKICDNVSEESGEEVICAPQDQDLRVCEGKLFAQHIDNVDPGSHTGSKLAEGLKDAGASGTLLNHSENRIDREQISNAIDICDNLDLTSIVCAQSPEECKDLSQLNPDFVAYEPPELIGGDKSVSEAHPSLIQEAVKQSEVPVLVGAGIKTQSDVEKSTDLGCEGVLVASGVVKAENQYQEVMELCKGL